MKILAVDTATKFLCLSLYDDGRIYVYNLEAGRKLSGMITVAIARATLAAGLDIRAIDYFACGIGPGSFTGVRIGVAAMKGLAWACARPMVALSTLDVLSRNVRAPEAVIAPAVDAKRGLVYCSFYKKGKTGYARKAPYMLLARDEFIDRLPAASVVLGDCLQLFGNQIRGATLLEKDYWYPQGACLIEVALELIRKRKTTTPQEIKPLYLYPKECQIKEGQRSKVRQG